MTDFFALLEQPRQPWLDPEVLKKKYHELVRSRHPDLTPLEANENFGSINEAYRVLADPKLRLQHLLTLENPNEKKSNKAPPELQEIFLEIGALLQKARQQLEEVAKAKNDLSRSLLRPELIKLRQQTADIQNRLTNLWNADMTEIERVNNSWQDDKVSAMTKLVRVSERVSYLSRWLTQLKEIKMQLSCI